MVKKITLLDPSNVVVTLKSWATGIITGLILVVPMFLSRYLMTKQIYGVAVIISILSLIGSLWIWGYLSKKLWGWN